MDFRHNLDALNAIMRDMARGGRFALAYSGGLDSRFLAHAAVLAGLRPLLLHAEGPHVASGDSRYARQWAAANGMELRLLKSDPLAVPAVAANDRMRCYHCKKALFSALLPEAGDLPLCDGTQAGDSGAYRPGVTAIKELGIKSPLADAGLDKPAIRSLAAQTGMERPEQRARPCLLTRFAYNLSPDRAALSALDKAEAAIETVLRNAVASGNTGGIPDFRLRYLRGGTMELHLTPLARTGGAPPPELLAALEDAVRQAFGKPPDAIRVMAELSGFFDKE